MIQQKNNKEKIAIYTPVPIWKSSTMAILAWVSLFASLIGSFLSINLNTIVSAVCFFIFICLFFLMLWLGDIVKRQIRVPLFCNYAINGFKNTITIERINVNNCPICGGKMKYYNKPMLVYINLEQNIIKRKPALECERNPEHCFLVDIAEDKML